MSRKPIGIIVALAALVVATVAAYGFRPQWSTDERKPDKSRHDEKSIAQRKQPATSSAQTAHKLERDNKIPAGSYKAVGPKAYVITRTHEFRPPGDALSHVKQLILRSEAGDATATYEVYLTIEQCRTFTSDRADKLADSAASIGSEHWFLEKSERLFNECAPLVLNQQIHQTDWLSKAAAMGSQEAMRVYSASPVKVVGSLNDAIRDPAKLDRWKNTAIGYVKELAAQGNADAIGDLATAYTYGGIVEADPVAALAYTRVLNRIDPRFATTNDISDYEQNLTSQEKEKARLLSNEIFGNCCTAH